MTSFRPNALGPASAGAGALTALGVVTDIDYPNLMAYVTDQSGAYIRASIRVRIGDGRTPGIGETWLLSKEYGTWMFIASVNNTPTLLSPRITTVDTTAMPSEILMVDATGGNVTVLVPTAKGFSVLIRKRDATGHAVVIKAIQPPTSATDLPQVNMAARAGLYINEMPPPPPGTYDGAASVQLTSQGDSRYVIGMGGYLATAWQ